RLAMREEESFFVIAGWNDLAVISLLNLLIHFGRRFAIWTDTPRTDQRRSPLKAVLRSGWLRFVFRHATSVMGTGSPALGALSEMGCPAEKLVNFPFFVDLQRFTSLARRDKVSPRDGLVFLSSGRLANEIKALDL